MTPTDLVERVAMAMATVEGNHVRPDLVLAPSDPLGYRALAVAAVTECRRSVEELAS